MARAMSKAAKAANYDGVQRQRDLNERLVSLLVNEIPPDAVELAPPDADGCTYEHRLYEARGALGGILIVIFASPANRRKSIDVYAFDEWLATAAKVPYGSPDRLAYKLAAERLAAARQKLYQDSTGGGAAMR